MSPTPIPEWDYLRILLNYTVAKQIQEKNPTVRQLSARLGIGWPTIERILTENKVKYAVYSLYSNANIREKIFVLLDLPKKVAEAFQYDQQRIQETGNRAFQKRPKGRLPRRLTKKDLQRMNRVKNKAAKKRIFNQRVRDFLKED